MAGLRPIDYNVVVKLNPAEERTSGGLILTTDTAEKDQYAATEGELVAVSPAAFSNADWPEDYPMPKVGQRVVFTKYAGAVREVGEDKYRVLQDKDILAVVEP